MTTKELKKIAEKMSIVTAMMNEVQEILGKEDFEMSYKNPAHVELLHAVDLADLAKIAKKKIQVRKFWGLYEGSFSIYGTTYKATLLDDDAKYFLENGIAVMKGANDEKESNK